VIQLRERNRRPGRERGLAPSTIRTYKAQLSGMLTMAVTLGYIAYNPALKVKTPKEPPRRIKTATGPDIAAVMEQMPGPVAEMLVHVAVQSGCRWGEITELRGRDVVVNPDDPDCDYLDVQRSGSTAAPLKRCGAWPSSNGR
jgi:integrase